jgi:hypothetical protein
MRRRVTISVPDDVYSDIKEMAGRRNMSMSAWLEQMLVEDFAANGIDLHKPERNSRSKAAEA